jgi:geranylgeranyl reductase family protein
MTNAVPERAEVLVVGAGPAGSTLAWDLARRGIRVVVLERATFPREKVCGDYIDPRGLRVLEAMGCLERLVVDGPAPITRTSTFVEWQRRFVGAVPFYGRDPDGLPDYGLTFPREVLDAEMLEAARAAGADVHEQTSVTDVSASRHGVTLTAKRGDRTIRYEARVVAGADGVNSVVARSQGLLVQDERRAAVAQRAYAVADDEPAGRDIAEIFYDRDIFPGYGWVFPAPGGRLNLGIGFLAEARAKMDANVPQLFNGFVEGLRRNHPRYRGLELVSKPIGGVVRTYGGAGPNCFDGGVLVGDAGRFVDPMTGEGITPAMESALLASPVLAAALESGDVSTTSLSAYEAAFRAYFDPSMAFLDLCAGMMRNRHLTKPWLRALARGCELAASDPDFALTSGSYFGGLEIRPMTIITQVWRRSLEDLALAWPRMFGSVVGIERPQAAAAPRDMVDWQVALSRSLISDPVWHGRWLLELQRQWARCLASSQAPDHRSAGVRPR